MIFDYTDSVAFLKECLVERAKTNPSYSMRAFARRLEISAGGLSLILSRKKRLSPERAAQVARALELDSHETEYFVTLNQLATAKSAEYRTQILEKILAIRASHGREGDQKSVLPVDQFRLISEWYGLACLELITSVTNKTGWFAKNIAEKLDITLAEADATVERLKRLGLVREVSPGVFEREASVVDVSSDIPNEAIRSYYEGVHLRSQASIRAQGPEAKAIGTQVFAFDPEDLNEVKGLTDEYLLALNRLGARGKHRTEIYQAVANVFRISNPSSEVTTVSTPSRQRKTSSKSAGKSRIQATTTQELKGETFV